MDWKIFIGVFVLFLLILPMPYQTTTAECPKGEGTCEMTTSWNVFYGAQYATGMTAGDYDTEMPTSFLPVWFLLVLVFTGVASKKFSKKKPE